MLSWGLTLGKERTVVLLAHVVVLLFSLKRFYMGRFYCDFVNEVEIKWLLNIFWQDFKAYSIRLCLRSSIYHDLGYANVMNTLSKPVACQHQSQSELLLLVCVEKVDGDICINMRSVLSRYLFTTSCNGVHHTTLDVHVC
ncbi:hypothetical protein Bca101_050319 [Brassica carinata]